MKKNWIGKIVATVLCVVLAFSAMACGKKGGGGPKTLVLATQQLDGVFNPYFYTAAYDGEIVGQTQVSMLSVSDDGKPYCGEDVPSVALDYSMEVVDNRNEQEKAENLKDDDKYYTTYKFLIKNGLKFSDGQPLTVKDVLFNMYVLLDPLYVGSSTLYSVNIKGMDAYRAQTDNENQMNNFEQYFNAAARARVQNLLAWTNETTPNGQDGFPTDPQVAKDLETLKKLYKEEVTADWNSAANMIADYNQKYGFTETWQVFMALYGYITFDSEKGEKPEAVENLAQWTTWAQGKTQDDFINYEWTNKVGGTGDTLKGYVRQILNFYATGQNIVTELANDEMSKYFEENKNPDGSLTVPNISGIKVETTRAFNGAVHGEKTFTEDYSVVVIEVGGVDPKAIWNLSVSVCPMHYYSTSALIAEADYTQNKFGVAFASQPFMDQMQAKLVPVGAGPYRAKGNPDVWKNSYKQTNTVEFEANPYFMMGEAKIKNLTYKIISATKIFESVTGATREVHYASTDAKPADIAALQNVKGVGSKQVSTLGYGYVGVNAYYVHDLEVRKAIMHAMDTTLTTAYYGGNNAKRVFRGLPTESWAYPTDVIAPYYAFDGTCRDEDGDGECDVHGTIDELIEEAGYTAGSDGVMQKFNANTGETDRLKFTFTIAGESTEHPAYSMFQKAQEILNNHGFDITIAPDAQALSKLASGKLQVWAAAWSSTIDPDMFQVYSIESKATSIKNWGYSYLLEYGSAQEKTMLSDLNDLIMEARESLDNADRIPKYHDAQDLVMDLAIELPTYQRTDLYIYNTKVLDESTFYFGADGKPNIYNGLLSRIWEVDFVK